MEINNSDVVGGENFEFSVEFEENCLPKRLAFPLWKGVIVSFESNKGRKNIEVSGNVFGKGTKKASRYGGSST